MTGAALWDNSNFRTPYSVKPMPLLTSMIEAVSGGRQKLCHRTIRTTHCGTIVDFLSDVSANVVQLSLGDRLHRSYHMRDGKDAIVAAPPTWLLNIQNF